mgnify:FL=1
MPERNSKRIVSVPEKVGDSVRNANFRIAEAYKLIRTNLLFTLANTDNRAVAFTSVEPSAGKSTTCCNLGIVMAQTGARVILVDADMRKPAQHRNFRVSKTEGLSKILGGLSALDDCVKKNVVPNLDLITSGATPPNPSELLGSARMVELLAELRKRYDYVFLDTPPLAVVTDALVLAPHIAGLVLIARSRQTTYDELSERVEAIRQINANMLGVIVTDVRTAGDGYSRYEKGRYYRSYDYEYSTHYDAKKRD